MFLIIRIALYFLFGVLAGQGIGVFDEIGGTFTVHVNDIATLIVGLVGSVLTFLSSRWAKAKGWLT